MSACSRKKSSNNRKKDKPEEPQEDVYDMLVVMKTESLTIQSDKNFPKKSGCCQSKLSVKATSLSHDVGFWQNLGGSGEPGTSNRKSQMLASLTKGHLSLAENCVELHGGTDVDTDDQRQNTGSHQVWFVEYNQPPMKQEAYHSLFDTLSYHRQCKTFNRNKGEKETNDSFKTNKTNPVKEIYTGQITRKSNIRVCKKLDKLVSYSRKQECFSDTYNIISDIRNDSERDSSTEKQTKTTSSCCKTETVERPCIVSSYADEDQNLSRKCRDQRNTAALRRLYDCWNRKPMASFMCIAKMSGIHKLKLKKIHICIMLTVGVCFELFLAGLMIHYHQLIIVKCFGSGYF